MAMESVENRNSRRFPTDSINEAKIKQFQDWLGQQMNGIFSYLASVCRILKIPRLFHCFYRLKSLAMSRASGMASLLGNG